MAIGHVEYSKYANGSRADAQPLVVRHIKGTMALASSGTLVNVPELREELELNGAIFHSSTDAEIISHVIIKERLSAKSIEAAVEQAMYRLKGSYSLLIMSPQKLIAARDPEGIHPLCMGQMGDDVVFASESCAFDSIGATFVRDAISEWLKIYDDNQRLMLVEALFRALDASGASDVGSLISGGSRTMSLIAEATRNLEEDDKGMLSDAGRDFMEIARGHAAKRAKKGVALSGERVARGISAGAAQIAQALENAAARHVERLSELVEEEDAEEQR